MDLFRVRLNCIDHYQAVPTRYDPQLRNDVRPFQISKGPKVPVIRVFGSTETGQKVCAHIHGAFPYMFVEYQGSLEPDEVGAYIYRLHLSIDHALAVSYRRDQFKDDATFVARITLVKGVPFYGFHVGYRFFLKIYVFNPMVMTRLADLLQQGVILKQKFQPYEAHLQYLLQFMTDYNLYGCDYLDSSRTHFRSPVPQYDQGSNPSHLWHSQSIAARHVTDDLGLPRVSHCSIEVDICVQHITNRNKIQERPLHHDFDERHNPLPSDVKLVYSMAGLWKDETKRRKRQMLSPDPGSSPFPPEVLVSMSADVRDSQPQGWLHEEEYRAHIQELISEEQSAENAPELDFDTFATKSPLEHAIQTVLQSVEDLYPSKLMPALGLSSSPLEEIGNDPASSIDVDEPKVLQVEEEVDCFFPSDSDEEALTMLASVERMAAKPPQSSVSPSPGSRKGVQHTTVADPLPVDLGFSSSDSLMGICESGLKTGKLPSLPFSQELIDIAEENEIVGETVESRQPTAGATSSLKRPRPDSLDHPPYKRARQIGFPSGQGSSPSEQGFVSPGQRSVPLGLKSHHSEVDSVPSGQTTYSPPHKATVRWEQRPLSTEPELLPSQQAFPSGQGDVLWDGRLTPTQATPADTHMESSPAAPSSPMETSSPGNDDDTFIKTSSSGKDNTTSSPTLKYPIVKDPDDASTKLRLSQMSQQSSSPRSEEESQVAKHVEFDLAAVATEEEFTLTQSDLSFSLSWPSSDDATDQLENLQRAMGDVSTSRTLIYSTLAPSADEVAATFKDYNIPDVIYKDAYYGRTKDVPTRTREYAGREFRLEGKGLQFLPEFDATATSPATYGIKKGTRPDKAAVAKEYARQRRECEWRSWEIAKPPPSYEHVQSWCEKRERRQLAKSSRARTPRHDLSQIDCPTPRNKHGFKYSQKQKSTSVEHEVSYMSTMSLEIHVNTRGKFVPNPEEDEVQCVFWALKSDETVLSSQDASQAIRSGIVVRAHDTDAARRIQRQTSANVIEEASELDLMVRMVEIVRTHDPDVLTGYEVHGSSWGYLIERARLRYDYNLCDEFSRMKTESHGRFGKANDKWGFNTTSTIRVTGRHMINIWRAMRGELNLLQYAMENVVWHLLHRRIPHYPWQTLTGWYTSGKHREASKLLHYYQERARLDIEILEANELIARTSEQARLLGVDFFSVFSRGSQFKVESIMFRIAKPENFLLVSPSRKQVGGQNALECLPLVMEPQSGFYNSPLLVLDFQSLYPSVMIAYNYCYSTFLGRITNWRGMNKMGFTEYQRQQGLLALLEDHINIAPNGMMYVKTEIRKSLLAKMLTEILETRVMVKSGMKQDKDDKALQQLLNNRQLALKLLANVTYGYTSASFSGRMPCSEIADSIVQTARETLERAIAYIHSVERWGAEVVYGDTDSLFIHLKGRTKDQAFDIGNEIAKAITEMNPRPIKLKFEKVYHPCVLLAKKRYVGHKYESKDQVKPVFDAKGIETVRRDGTPAEQKIEEKALRMLFENPDLSRIKAYFQAQCKKIMRNKVSVQDFCFAKEVRLGTYSNKGPPPAGALISTKRMLRDARAEPQYGERVPYVVITGAPGARLIDRCVAPEELLSNPQWQLDAEYYISKNLIPPLERIFNLVGASVRQWYDEVPKTKRIHHATLLSKKKTTIEAYLRSTHCVVCNARFQYVDSPMCRRCKRNTTASIMTLQKKVSDEERKFEEVLAMCRSCSGLGPLEEVLCDSKDCPVFWTRMRQEIKMKTERLVRGPTIKALTEGVERKALEW